MLRRCVLELSSSSSRSVGKCRALVTAQTPFFLSSRRDLSSASKSPQGTSGQKPLKPPPGPAVEQKPSASGSFSFIPKLLLGSIVVGAAVIAADQTGYIDIVFLRSKNEKPPLQSNNVSAVPKLKDTGHAEDTTVLPDREPSILRPPTEEVSEKSDKHDYIENKDVNSNGATEKTSVGEEPSAVKEKEMPGGEFSLPEEQTSGGEISSEDSINVDDSVAQTEATSEGNNAEISYGNQVEINSQDQIPIPEEITTKETVPEELSKDSIEHEIKAPASVSKAYSLQDGEIPEIPSNKENDASYTPTSAEKEVLSSTAKCSEDADKSKDGKVVLDLIQAIHAAEKRQAESDFRIFEEEKRLLKEKYEKELRDARARELMYAEEAALLDKELNKEREKAEATVKMLQEKAEQNLKTELQRKEEEMEIQLQKAKDLAKAELNAAIANEKSSQVEKIAESDLHIKALCMAFYARSEEARQSHSVHKLALGALALEDALSNGLPIRSEINALYASLVDIKSDPLIDLVISSLPEETLDNGTETKLQLNQKFDALKGTLRHFSLIPAGGGGILTHTLARIASSIKIKERDISGDGIESVISRVENLLAEGKLSEAADALENGVSGTDAEGAVRTWVKLVRNRAMTEQALALIQSYATSISLA